MILYRNCKSRVPFLWEIPDQPQARWHGDGEGPAQYLADTPNGAWAEFMRHEGIVDPIDLQGVHHALWAVNVDDAEFASPELPHETVTGDPNSYRECQDEALRLRSNGAKALRAPSAALFQGGARGWRVDRGLQQGEDADGEVLVLFGTRPQVIGWRVVDRGAPPAELIPLVRPLW